MRKALKIILIVGAFILCNVILVLIKFAAGNGSNSGGMGAVSVILLLAFLAGARAIWKYNPEKKKDESKDNHQLDKK